MASFNYYLKDGKAKGTTPIYLLFDDGVNRGKFYIQQSIAVADWNAAKQEARRSLKGFADFNGKLSNINDKCREYHLNLTKEGKFTVDALKLLLKDYIDELNNRKKVNNGETKTFERLIDFANHYLKTAGAVKKKVSIKSNQQTVDHLADYEIARRKRIKFDNINLDFYQDFVDYLTNEKEMSNNTIGKHIKTLKIFLNEATERGINTKMDFKSKRFKTITEDTEPIYLSEAELEKMYKHDFSKDKRLEKTRDLFIIGCCTGLRFSDFSQLRPENIGDKFIKVRTQKTDEIVIIPIHHWLKELLNKYALEDNGLPQAISNQKMNEHLKDVGSAVKINEPVLLTKTKGGVVVKTSVPKYKLLTTHSARRSFASNLYLSGFPPISIMKITGHKTEKAFMRYICITSEESAKMLSRHWDEKVKQEQAAKAKSRKARKALA